VSLKCVREGVSVKEMSIKGVSILKVSVTGVSESDRVSVTV
jgi:hypothetical protein